MVIKNKHKKKGYDSHVPEKSASPGPMCVHLPVCWYDTKCISGRKCKFNHCNTLLYITDAKVRFAIDKGIATIKASVIGQDGVDRCKVEVTLQEKVGSTWKIVGTWTDETGGVRASVSETKAVTAGKTYRAKVVVTAWSGSKSETKTILSPEKKA